MISGIGGASCASIGFTGVPGVKFNSLSPASPFSFATTAIKPKSFVSIIALSTTVLSILDAWAIASLTTPSPTPILSSSRIVRVKYFASLAEA